MPSRLTLTAESPAVAASIDAYETAVAAWLADPTPDTRAAVGAAWAAQAATMGGARRG